MRLYPENGDCLSTFVLDQFDALRMIGRGSTVDEVVQECNDREEDILDLMKDLEGMLSDVRTVRRLLNKE